MDTEHEQQPRERPDNERYRGPGYDDDAGALGRVTPAVVLGVVALVLGVGGQLRRLGAVCVERPGSRCRLLNDRCLNAGRYSRRGVCCRGGFVVELGRELGDDLGLGANSAARSTAASSRARPRVRPLIASVPPCKSEMWGSSIT
jgi:hypothetical protein